MIRLFLYAVIAYFVWKIVKVFATPRKYRREDSPEKKAPTGAKPDFSNIKDAEFEDLPPARPPADPPPSAS